MRVGPSFVLVGWRERRPSGIASLLWSRTATMSTAPCGTESTDGVYASGVAPQLEHSTVSDARRLIEQTA